MILKMNKIHELLGYENIKIIQNDEMFSFSLDSMLLANFIDTHNAKEIIDLGCGNAPIPLFLTLKTNAYITGVEIQEEVYKLAVESVKLNNFNEQIEIINDDLKDIYKKLGANRFDIVSCNPPFFKATDALKNHNDFLTIARHEVKATIDDIVKEANKLLIDGGNLYLVHRVLRMIDVLDVLKKYNFGIKRMQFIYPVKDKEAQSFLIQASKNRKDNLKVDKPIVVYENNKDTQEVLDIFNFKK